MSSQGKNRKNVISIRKSRNKILAANKTIILSKCNAVAVNDSICLTLCQINFCRKLTLSNNIASHVITYCLYYNIASHVHFDVVINKMIKVTLENEKGKLI